MDLDRDPRPPSPGPRIPIIRVGPGETLNCHCVSPGIQGFWTHWLGDRSQPHYRDPAECPGCKIGAPKRWKGYLFCIIHEKRVNAFIEVTPATALQLGEQLDQGESLRGVMLQFKRTAKKNGRLAVTVLTNRIDSKKLPPDQDCEATLRNLWGIPRIADLESKKYLA